MKWMEAFSNHLHHCISVRMTVLAYVMQDEVTVDIVCPPLKTDQPFTEDHGSVDDDLIHCTLHSHGLYIDDNASVYFKFEEVTRDIAYTTLINPYQKKKDGREAFLALIHQHVGTNKW